MPEIYRGQLPESATYKGYITADGRIFEGGIGGEGGTYIGRVTQGGLVYRGGELEANSEYAGRILPVGGVYKGRIIPSENEQCIGHVFQGYDFWMLTEGGIGSEGGSIVGYMKKPAGSIFDPINGIHAGAGLLLLLQE